MLLLLIRLGLRAGAVATLRFSDLCVESAAIRVSQLKGAAGAERVTSLRASGASRRQEPTASQAVTP